MTSTTLASRRRTPVAWTAPVTPASPNRQRLHQLGHQVRGLEPELLVQDAAEEPVLPERLPRIALRQVDLDQRAVGALAEHLALDRGEPGVGCLGEAARSGALLAQALERVRPSLQSAVRRLAFARSSLESSQRFPATYRR